MSAAPDLPVDGFIAYRWSSHAYGLDLVEGLRLFSNTTERDMEQQSEPRVCGRWVREGIHHCMFTTFPLFGIKLLYAPDSYHDIPGLRQAAASSHVLPPATLSLPDDQDNCQLRNENNGVCNFNELPEEILIQIMEQCGVPEGCIFHISNRSVRDTREYLTIMNTRIVHQVVPWKASQHRFREHESSSVPKDNLCAVAGISRRVNQIFNRMLYGHNQFILEPHRQSTQILYLDSPPEDATSWTYEFEADYYGRTRGIWPLTPRTAVYVQDLTILTTLEEQEGQRDKVIQSHKQIFESFVSALGTNHSLYILRVTVNRGHVFRQGPGEWYRYSRFCGYEVDFEEGKCRDGPEIEAYADIWTPFKQLRGIECPIFSGMITNQLEAELRQTITEKEFEEDWYE